MRRCGSHSQIGVGGRPRGGVDDRSNRLANAGESLINAKAKFTAQTLAEEQEMRKLVPCVEHLESLIVLKRQPLTLLRQMAESYETLYREGMFSSL